MNLLWINTWLEIIFGLKSRSLICCCSIDSAVNITWLVSDMWLVNLEKLVQVAPNQNSPWNSVKNCYFKDFKGKNHQKLKVTAFYFIWHIYSFLDIFNLGKNNDYLFDKFCWVKPHRVNWRNLVYTGYAQ